jgi:hypothetical protein
MDYWGASFVQAPSKQFLFSVGIELTFLVAAVGSEETALESHPDRCHQKCLLTPYSQILDFTKIEYEIFDF